jgi:hypothetical protein
MNFNQINEGQPHQKHPQLNTISVVIIINMTFFKSRKKNKMKKY